MYALYFLLGFLTIDLQLRPVQICTLNDGKSSASYSMGNSNSMGGSNGGSQMEDEGAPSLVQTPVMYSAPVVSALPVAPVVQPVPISPVVHYSMNPPRSEVRNLVGSYAREEGHLSDTMLDLPFRKARARKMAARKAARKHKNLKKQRKVNRK